MGKYNSELDKLFRNWIAESEKNNEPRENQGYGDIIFTKDGIMEKPDESIDVELEWENSKKRIMFILKDQPSKWCNDARLWLKRKDNQELKSKFIKNIAYIFWGLYNGNKKNLCTFDDLMSNIDDVKRCFNKYPFAFVESKKQGGETKISNSKLQNYLKKYREFIIQELKILEPNIIVCTSTIIYKFVCELYTDNELLKIEGHNSIRIHRKTGTIILCSYHPSAIKSTVTIYEGVMDHYRAFLLSDYSNENGLIK